MHQKVSRLFLVLGSISATTAVALGAFGAHGLKNTLTPDLLLVFETAVRYQMYHAFALLIAGILAMSSQNLNIRTLELAGWSFVVGTVVFCGSLYTLVLFNQHWLGAITPLGGLAFIFGWLLLGWTYLRTSG